MSEMIEKVAASLHVEGLMVPYAGLPEIMKDKYRMMAKRAIETMREPTAGMLWVGPRDLGSGGDLSEGNCMKEIWQDMIDEALSDKTDDMLKQPDVIERLKKANNK